MAAKIIHVKARRAWVRFTLLIVAAGSMALFLSPHRALAQRPQVTVQAPLHGVSDGFFERIGFGGSFRAPGFNLNLGGFPNAVPQFGGFQPGAGLQGGFGINGGGFGARFGFEFSQGSRRSNVMQAPMVTMMNGVPGIVSDITQSPFVISGGPQVPLRGDALPWKNQLPLRVPFRPQTEDHDVLLRAPALAKPPGDAIAAQAAAGGDRPLTSVAEIRRQRQAAEEAKKQHVLEHMARGAKAEKEGKPGVARVYYQMALRGASGELLEKVQERLKRLNGK